MKNRFLPLQITVIDQNLWPLLKTFKVRLFLYESIKMTCICDGFSPQDLKRPGNLELWSEPFFTLKDETC